jgi:predicted phosphate transport protein (TIGR00153 family)
MANKADRFYFENFVAATEQSCLAAHYLVECLTEYDASKLSTMLESMHAMEHEGDGKKHEMSAALARAFVTPIDREDLDLISHNIDDVTDNIEEVLQRFYMNRITAVLPDAVEFARKLESCCALMKDIMVEFVNFKKSTKLHDMIVELNHVEEECDQLYLLAVYNLRDHCADVLDIISWREIYDCLEACADACEHVGDCVETVIMKNT